jgi:iron complex outermembrane receptor protein
MTTIEGYSITNLSLALVEPDEKWRVALQVKNVFDQSFASSIVSGGPGGSFRYIIPREADRYVSIGARINF